MTAAELALGLLEDDERAAAQRRVLADPAFAAEVEQWRLHFAGLFGGVPEVGPPATVLARIEASLAAEDAPVISMWRRRLWPVVAAVSSIAAAILLFLVLNAPEPVAPRVAAPPVVELAAAVVKSDGGDAMTAIYSPATGELRLSATALADVRHAAELWVIGDDGVPHSLGLLRTARATAFRVTEGNQRRFTPAAVLAVSLEPVGGSPTGKPTGPVIAKGTLSQI